MKLGIYRMTQELRSLFWEVIVSVTLSKNVYMYICSIPNGFRDTAISLYSTKIVDEREILRTVPNTSIYCSSDKVGTVYRQHQCTMQLVWGHDVFLACILFRDSEIALSRKPLGRGRMCIYTFLFRMSDTTASIILTSPPGAFCISGTWAHLNGVLHKVLPSACVCIPLPWLGKGSVKALPRQRIHTILEDLLYASFCMQSISFQRKIRD
jgi:hypothetical protein